MTIQVSEAKTVEGTLQVGFDFSGRVLPGETLTAGGCSALTFNGEDESPENIIIGAPFQNGLEVVQTITGGLPGVTYLVNCGGETNLGNIYIIQTLISVLPADPYE